MIQRRLAALILAIAFTGAACNQSATPNPTAPDAAPVELTIWRVFEKPDVFSRVIAAYTKDHPNVTITVVEKPYADYELEVANAIAAGNPPDIWMVRNDWLPKHVDKLQAMPDELLTGGTAKKKKDARANTNLIKDHYPAVASTEAIVGDKVYGIPLAVDTLALYYNVDQLKDAGVKPPSTWNEFVAVIPKLVKYDAGDPTKITHAAAAIGTANNVNRAIDLLSLLMLQNQTPMTTDDHTSSLINSGREKQGGGIDYPGTNALEFYTAFANPKKTVYTWNNSQLNSVDAFAQEQVSMIFSYGYLERTLLQKNPTLNYRVAPMLQIDNTPESIDYATYWLEGVSRNSKNAAVAWDFLKYLYDGGDELYQQAAGKPAAKKVAEIPAPNERDLETTEGAPWNFQSATAKTWYRGTNPGKVEQVIAEMIENVVSYNQQPQVAIDNAANQITKSLRDEE